MARPRKVAALFPVWDGFVGPLGALLPALKNRGRSRSEEAAARAVEGVEAATVLETVKCRNYLGTGSSRRPQLMKTNGAAGGWALPPLSPMEPSSLDETCPGMSRKGERVEPPDTP